MNEINHVVVMASLSAQSPEGKYNKKQRIDQQELQRKRRIALRQNIIPYTPIRVFKQFNHNRPQNSEKSPCTTTYNGQVKEILHVQVIFKS
jgi:hypothetical protein